MTASERIILSLDGIRRKTELLKLVECIGHRVYAVKLHEAIDRFGPKLIRDVRKAGARRVFVDHKFHDTPDSVRLRCAAYKRHGADILTVHALGGPEMMRAAHECGLEIAAVTLLSSHASCDLAQVISLARSAKGVGIQSLVCSPHELDTLVPLLALRDLCFITPGIRWEGSKAYDQKRTMTPVAALESGARRIVVGRLVTHAPDPIAAFMRLEVEVRTFVDGGTYAA